MIRILEKISKKLNANRQFEKTISFIDRTLHLVHKNPMEIKIAKTESEILSTFPILKQLRPQLVESEFIITVRRMEKEGFILCYLFDSEVRAVGGFRYMELFSTGKILYVDDLVTDSRFRSRGYGKNLLDWLFKQSKLNGCKYLELDSGSKRLDAHKFYRRYGLKDIALHVLV